MDAAIWVGPLVMTSGQRFLLVLAVALAALFGLSLCGYQYWEVEAQKESPISFMLASATSRAEAEPEPCMNEQTREQIRGVLFEGLDEALKDHVKHVFEVWLRDDRGQPGRARTGVTNGVKAYLGARKGVVEWSPPICSG